MSERTCGVDDCDRSVLARGWCRMHYLRWYKHGDPAIDRRAERQDPRDRFARLVDLDGPISSYRPDLGNCHLWLGTISSSGYGLFNMGGRQNIAGAHVAAILLTGLRIPAGHDVDHLCYVRLCVRLQHLEVVTKAENLRREAEHRRHVRMT